MITIDTRLFGTKKTDGISIIKDTELGNPFSIGEQNCITGERIRSKPDMLHAYDGWIRYRIKAQIPSTIKALDEIAFAHLDGKEVILNCTCNDDLHCHGRIIRDIIMEKIDANRSGSRR